MSQTTVERQWTQLVPLGIKRVDGAKRRISGVASQQLEDRAGDVVVVGGIDLADFKRNPVLLADHDHGFPIGRVDRLWIEPSRAEGPALCFEAELLAAGTSARVDERVSAIQQGAVSGISIGFLARETEQRTSLTGAPGLRFTRSTLLEISSVAIPACQTCLVESRACPHATPADGPVVLELIDPLPSEDYLVVETEGREVRVPRSTLERIITDRLQREFGRGSLLQRRVSAAVEAAVARATARPTPRR